MPIALNVKYTIVYKIFEYYFVNIISWHAIIYIMVKQHI